MIGIIDKDYECIESDRGLSLWMNETLEKPVIEISVLGSRDTDSTVTLSPESARDLAKTILENSEKNS